MHVWSVLCDWILKPRTYKRIPTLMSTWDDMQNQIRKSALFF